MTRKKTIKQLMAVGISRNDAASFAATYRRIVEAGRDELFPKIILPSSPVNPIACAQKQREIVKLRSCGSYFLYDSSVTDLAYFQGHIKRELAQRLTHALMDQCLITFESRNYPDTFGMVEVRATLEVVRPNK